MLGERLDPNDLMPQPGSNGLTSLSLFAGGGGLDLGFERAGFEHRASFEILDICGATLHANRPNWDVRSGAAAGDVRAAPFTLRGLTWFMAGRRASPSRLQANRPVPRIPQHVAGLRSLCAADAPRAFIAERIAWHA